MVCPQLEENDTIYEFLVAPSSGIWQHWREKVPLWRYPAGEERPKFAQLVIPTLDSVRYEHLMSLVHSVGKVRQRQSRPQSMCTFAVSQDSPPCGLVLC